MPSVYYHHIFLLFYKENRLTFRYSLVMYLPTVSTTFWYISMNMDRRRRLVHLYENGYVCGGNYIAASRLTYMLIRMKQSICKNINLKGSTFVYSKIKRWIFRRWPLTLCLQTCDRNVRSKEVWIKKDRKVAKWKPGVIVWTIAILRRWFKRDENSSSFTLRLWVRFKKYQQKE